MAEAALFSLACKLLPELTSPLFKRAYERIQSIRKAREDLDKLSKTIRIIQAVLLDAERRQEGPGPESEAVREWIQMVRDVLYDADDLFDEVATDTLLKQQQLKKDATLSKVMAGSVKKSDNRPCLAVRELDERMHELKNELKYFEGEYDENHKTKAIEALN